MDDNNNSTYYQLNFIDYHGEEWRQAVCTDTMELGYKVNPATTSSNLKIRATLFLSIAIAREFYLKSNQTSQVTITLISSAT